MGERRWKDVLIVCGLLVILTIGVVTVFDEEIARLRGGPERAPEPPAGSAVPPAPGNTQAL
jgi:hypothetical protein